MSRLAVHARRPVLPFIRLAISAAVCFLCSTTVQAIPLADYHNNLQRAITALDTLSQIDENETPTVYENRLIQTLETVRSILPKTQTVQKGMEVFTVDNGWLHDELDALGKTPAAERFEHLVHLLERLRSIEQRVLELQQPAGTTIDKTQAREKMGEILTRPEYAPKGKATSAFMRLLNDFIRWLEKFLPKRTPLAPSRANSLVKFAQILVIALCVLVLLYVLRVFLPQFARAKKRKDKKKSEPRIVLGEQLTAEESARDLLSEAELLARNGELRAAIRKAYIALLVELGDRELISLAQHKTNRDYLRSVRSVPGLYANMSTLTDVFERYWYGLAQPTALDWQVFRDGYQETLKTRS